MLGSTAPSAGGMTSDLRSDDPVGTGLGRLTLDEKAALTAGADMWHTAVVERLGIGSLRLTDGPSGARGTRFSGEVSLSLPCGTAMGATWNRELVGQVGQVLGAEARDKGAHVLLAPTVNIQRHPLAGRNFECFSEDPYLSAELAVAYVDGVQERGVGCAIKHFVANDQEHDRLKISVEVDERTLREIYLPPFEAAVRRAGVWAMMAAYNRLNGVYCSEHSRLLQTILRDEWGFDGLVISDWFGTNSTSAVEAGLDLEMPGPARFLGSWLAAAVRQGDVGEAVLDRAVQRLFDLAERTATVPAEEHIDREALARQVAAESIVLLSNDGVLPLEASELGSLAVVGPKADRPDIQGRGSAHVDPPRVTTPLQAIAARAGDAVAVRHEPGVVRLAPAPLGMRELQIPDDSEPGLVVEYFAGADESPVHVETMSETQLFWLGAPAEGIADRFVARASARLMPDHSGTWRLSLSSAGRSQVLLDGEVRVDNMEPTRGDSFFGRGSTEVHADVDLVAGRRYELVAELHGRVKALNSINGLSLLAQPPERPDALAQAVDAARQSDVAVVVVGGDQADTEGHDRRTMDLPEDQVELVRAVAAVNPATVVLLNTGAPVTIDWADEVAALLQTWYLGQEAGVGVADVLFGDRDATGRLPTTFPRRLEDSPAFPTYPGSDGRTRYSEGVLVGYRHYDTYDVEPRFCFGHGLSYTEFEYGTLDVELLADGPSGPQARVKLDVTNVGTRAGCEAVQLYVHAVESFVSRPEHELRQFTKLRLEPGSTETVQFELGPRAFAYWDVGRHGWTVEPGEYEIRAGSSSRHIRSTGRIYLS